MDEKTKRERIRDEYAEDVLNQLKHMRQLDRNSPEFAAAVTNANKMTAQLLAIQKADDEAVDANRKYIEEKSKRLAEESLKQQQFMENKRQFDNKFVLDVATTAAKFGFLAVISRWQAVVESGGVLSSMGAKDLARTVKKFIEIK